jgi:hypothetical protein
MRGVDVRWITPGLAAKEGRARILALEGGAIRLWSSVPSPPGSRIDGECACDAPAPVPVRVKVHASRAQPEADGGGYVIEGRTIDMAKDVRERLTALLS